MNRVFQINRLLFILLFLCAGLDSWAESAGHVSGTVDVSPRLKSKVTTGAVLFIYARKLGTQGGPPLAVVKVASPTFPQKFELGPENAMMPGVPFKGPFQIQAKLSKTGSVGTSKGDLLGKYAPAKGVAEGDAGVKVTLSEEAP